MEPENLATDSPGGCAEVACAEASCLESVKKTIADTLHTTAETLGQKAASFEAQPTIARYGKQASEWLEQSSAYVREFDYEQTDAKIREYVRQSPGRTMMMAGAAGLVIGVMLRRR